MLSQLLIIVCATFCLATAAPHAELASTDDSSVDDLSHIELPLSSDDGDELDIDGNNVDTIEDPPEPNYLVDEEEFRPREMRSENYLRFGRSSGAASKNARSKEDRNVRFSRGFELDDNFIRLGRSANFVRFGRRDADADGKPPVTRSANSNFIRLGRAKTEPSNYIRFGRGGGGGGGNGFIRFGRDGNEYEMTGPDYELSNSSFARLARADKVDSNFIRFGRDKINSNFMRLGRNDNFLRFGKGDNFLRFGRGSADNFIRFGRAKNTELFGRGKLTDRNFIRLGRSDGGHFDGQEVGLSDELSGKRSSKYIRFGKRVPDIQNANNKFMRFGRDVELIEERPQSSSNRSKRSLVPDDEIIHTDYENTGENKEMMAVLPFRFYSPLVNAPFAPELTVLPLSHSKRATGGGNGNFIRFG